MFSSVYSADNLTHPQLITSIPDCALKDLFRTVVIEIALVWFEISAIQLCSIHKKIIMKIETHLPTPLIYKLPRFRFLMRMQHDLFMTEDVNR